MYSIASWSPSQSEPLMVSYMCQSQLSSDMLPSAAPMPPWAATVCERVGKTFDRTATERPASASCSEARIPAPPAPTTMASNLRTGNPALTGGPPRLRPHWTIRPLRCPQKRGRYSHLGAALRCSPRSPQDVDEPAGIAEQHDDGQHLQRQPQRGRLDVVHPDVTHADPGMPEEREPEKQRRHPEGGVGEQRLPQIVIHAAVVSGNHQPQQRVERHRHRGEALGEPVLEPVVGADDDALHHRSAPMMRVSPRLTTSTTALDWRVGLRSMNWWISRSR